MIMIGRACLARITSRLASKCLILKAEGEPSWGFIVCHVGEGRVCGCQVGAHAPAWELKEQQ